MSAMLKLSFVFSEANDRKWCIAKPSTPDAQLEMNIQYVCESQRYHKIDCSAIRPGGSCYNPSNKVSSASMVIDLYFQPEGQTTNACHFNGSGMIVYENPSE
ncbi:putative X8 domain-containing protein [Rosa chinensis]|uniref:Putative X8 domain-containing protein n=1 Tax=Rosa chinensis TaxID=74649 RepID=A0A2P6QZJ3_ROSCH|nr:major pollen allergen Ole e 10 [Rosa chinensis]PRQ39608.1 putative X8 domain-containing protein [Rosa chinensis]